MQPKVVVAPASCSPIITILHVQGSSNGTAIESCSNYEPKSTWCAGMYSIITGYVAMYHYYPASTLQDLTDY